MKINLITVECQKDEILILGMLKSCYHSKMQFEKELPCIVDSIAVTLNLFGRIQGDTIIFSKKMN